jgi:hypothetical protein
MLMELAPSHCCHISYMASVNNLHIQDQKHPTFLIVEDLNELIMLYSIGFYVETTTLKISRP